MKKLTRAEARRLDWEDPIKRQALIDGRSIGAKKRYQNPEERRLASERAKAQFADPEQKAKWLEAHRAAKLKDRIPDANSKKPEYKIWDAMISRCLRPKTAQYEDYGGRGIVVCSEWVGPGGFQRWFDHIGARPTPKHTLGRKNNDGNYEPGNVRWETRLEQMANYRRNHPVTLQGETLHLTEWARRLGVSAPTLAYRIKAGWPEHEILSAPGTFLGRN